MQRPTGLIFGTRTFVQAHHGNCTSADTESSCQQKDMDGNYWFAVAYGYIEDTEMSNQSSAGIEQSHRALLFPGITIVAVT